MTKPAKKRKRQGCDDGDTIRTRHRVVQSRRDAAPEILEPGELTASFESTLLEVCEATYRGDLTPSRLEAILAITRIGVYSRLQTNVGIPRRSPLAGEESSNG